MTLSRKEQARGSLFLWMVVLVVIAARPAQGDSLQPVSIVNVPVNPPAGGSGDSFSPILSPDGRYVVFASLANNLALLNVPNPAPPRVPPVLNVFLRDRLDHTTKLVSVSGDGAGGGNLDSIPRGLSTNGQYALFESAANNLIAGDANNASDIFVRDLVNNVTLLVSVSTNGATANGISRSAVMTPDGRYVTFVSAANDLVPGDTNGIADVFVRDLQAGTTVLASVGARSNTGGGSELPAITPQGRYVAFYSTATNLVPGVTNTGEIFVRDLVAGTTAWASTNSHAIMKAVLNTSNAVACNHEISGDGQFVAFEACPFSSSGVRSWARGILLRQNLATGLTDIVNTNISGIAAGSELTAHNLSMTPDGRFIAFLANAYGTNGSTTAVEVWDGQSNTTVVASLDLSQSLLTNSICDSPDMTPDGRFVAFLSNATNLTANPLTSGFHLYRCDLQTATTVLVDADTNGFSPALNPMTAPQLSADGSAVAFEALDGSLVANDNNKACDVFVRNVTGASTELISVGLPGWPSLAPNGSSVISSSCVSSNGRYVAFFSEADNLTLGDTNGVRDVYVRDLANGTNLLVSVNTNGMAGNGASMDAAISGTGRFVAFTSGATDLVANDTTNAPDIFLRDLLSGTTTLVSMNTNGNGPGNNASSSPSVSDDGRYVLFFSRAGDLVSGNVGNVNGNLFWRDLLAGTNRAITTFSSSATVNAINAAMSADGKRVAYSVQSNNLQSAVIFVWDAQLAANVYTNLVATPVYKVGISPAGNRVIYYRAVEVGLVDVTTGNKLVFSNSTSHAGFQFSADNQSLAYVASNNVVCLYDFGAASNVLVSAGANGVSDSPAISADGRFIAYRSTASNLVPGDSNGVPDIFLYDRLSGTTALVTASPYGNWPANGRSFSPVFSGDGQTLVWQGWANNLAGQTFNQGCNLFALQAFATNSADSQPSFGISAFGLSSLAGMGSSANVPALVWQTWPGSNYLVQFKNTLTDPDWQNLTGAIRLIGNQGFVVDPTPDSAQRFYRVLEF